MSGSERSLDRAFPGRRGVLSALGGVLLAGALTGCKGQGAAAAAPTALPDRKDSEALTWKEARKILEEGNARFLEGKVGHPDQGMVRRKQLGSDGQAPFACVLACADSRVPPELVFDQGLGDLFVVRSAGQVVDRAVLGTLQFGVTEFRTPLLVVLGHTRCGAVKATVEALAKHARPSGTDVDALLTAIAPAVHEAEELGAKGDDLLTVAVDNNVDRVVGQLNAAKVIAVAVKSRKLKILGATYDLETGEVTFA